MEAECAEVGANWAEELNPEASNGKYIVHKVGNKYDAAPAGFDNRIRFNFSILNTGIYKIFARTLTNNEADDSFWVRVDNQDWVRWNNINYPYENTGFNWHQVG